jgi:NitT/TauT family transport system permease protein
MAEEQILQPRQRAPRKLSAAPARAPLWRRWGVPVAAVAAFFVAWQLIAVAYEGTSLTASASRVPLPLAIAQTLVDSRGGFASALGNTARGALIGLAAGIVIAVVLSVTAVSMRWLEDTIYPYLIASQMVPTIVLAPIVFAVVKNGAVATVVVAAYVSFFVIVVNMTRGLKSVGPDQLALLHSIRAKRWQYYTKLRLWASLPFFFAGLKIAAPLAVVGEIVVELTGAHTGLGQLMINSLNYGGSQLYAFWGSVVITAALGYALYLLATVLERKLTPWQHEFRSRA